MPQPTSSVWSPCPPRLPAKRVRTDRVPLNWSRIKASSASTIPRRRLVQAPPRDREFCVTDPRRPRHPAVRRASVQVLCRMSETRKDPIDLRSILARIDRDLAESGKLRSEQRKLDAEQRKLDAEQRKLSRDHWLAPVLAIAAVIGGLLGVASFIAKVV